MRGKNNRITDEALVRLIYKGSHKGAEVLYDTYAGFLFLAIRRILPETGTAEKVLAQTLHMIWRSIKEYEIEKERIYTWMIKIARNNALAEATTTYE